MNFWIWERKLVLGALEALFWGQNGIAKAKNRSEF